MNVDFLFPIAVFTLRYFVLGGLIFLIFYKLFSKKLSTSKIQSRLAKHKDFIREITHSLKSNLILGGMVGIFAYTPLRDYSFLYRDVNEYPLWWMPVSLLVALFIHDTYFYWMHRTIHHPRLYKTFHILHHKSVNPSPWASFAFNTSEAVLEALIVPILMWVLPMHYTMLVSFGFLSFFGNVYGHLGYEITPRWFRHTWLFEILNTSVYHNVHHSRFKGNYSLYFRHWDRWRNTEHPDYVKEFDELQAKRFGENVLEREAHLVSK
ncbi:MAG: sterol desaturase family protein [Bacteroidia bacterium]